MVEPIRFAVVVPTLNAGSLWTAWFGEFCKQSLLPAHVLVVDSESDDDTAAHARDAGCELLAIRRADFNHGLTRQRAAEHLRDVDVLVYMTQDAILAGPDSLRHLVEAFADPAVGAAYGRQLPRIGAGLFEAHGRLFNYPDRSHTVTPQNAAAWGIKGPFLSDSYTAYRRSALLACGGFPRAIVSEDMYVGARLLLGGWHLRYVAEATVHHSHSYSLKQDFHRYFDIGAFYSEQAWLLRDFGRSSGEGLRFALSELRYLARHAPWRIPEALLRTAIKYAAFKAGQRQRWLSPGWRRRLSGQKYYWRSSSPSLVSEPAQVRMEK